MNKITKYIFNEIFPIFLLSNMFFIFVLLLDKVIDLTDLIFSKNVPFLLVFETIVFYLPSFLMITIPTSALLSVMTAHNRLSADAEIVVIKSLGVSPFNLFKPTFYFGILATLLAFLTSFYLLPYGNKLAIENLKRTLEYVSLKDIREKEFYKEIPGITIFIEKKLKEDQFQKIIIIDEKGENFIIAKECSAKQEFGAIIFDLYNGSIIQGKSDKYTKIEFKRFYFVFNVQNNLNREIKSERFMFLDELLKKQHENKIYKFELSKRIALPFSTIIMTVLGLNLGIFFHRSNKSINWLISLAIVFFYNLIILASENFLSVLNPYFAPWIANIIFAFVSIIGIKKVLQ
ncbi:MAG: LptF/LptG family permease [Calditerrivibrio sp.]|nr:LptF/LptG family permease [Calditerrivibrio sp.]